MSERSGEEKKKEVVSDRCICHEKKRERGERTKLDLLEKERRKRVSRNDTSSFANLIWPPVLAGMLLLCILPVGFASVLSFVSFLIRFFSFFIYVRFERSVAGNRAKVAISRATQIHSNPIQSTAEAAQKKKRTCMCSLY